MKTIRLESIAYHVLLCLNLIVGIIAGASGRVDVAVMLASVSVFCIGGKVMDIWNMMKDKEAEK